jgi:hypothetical protein
LPDARLPRPELALFSRVALRDGLFTCFSGEWSDPTLVLDSAPVSSETHVVSEIGGDTCDIQPCRRFLWLVDNIPSCGCIHGEG